MTKFKVTLDDGTAGRQEGFTLTELLVILAVVALLFVLQVSAGVNTKARTKVAMCASNVHQLTLALHLYAGDNSDKLPNLGQPAPITWAWDLPWTPGETLLTYVAGGKRVFYDPGTAPHFGDQQNFLDPTPGRNLWDYGETPQPQYGFHVAGYVFALNQYLLIPTNRNTSILAEPVRLTTSPVGPTLAPPPNAERVLVAGATLSSQSLGDYAQRYTYNYTDILGGFYLHHTCPHLRGQFPAGGNLGFKDGHVAWRKFDDMNPRTSGGGPTFWW